MSKSSELTELYGRYVLPRGTMIMVPRDYLKPMVVYVDGALLTERLLRPGGAVSVALAEPDSSHVKQALTEALDARMETLNAAQVGRTRGRTEGEEKGA